MSNIVKIAFKTKNELAKAYVRQFKNGGIFVSGSFNHVLGDEFFLIIELPESNEPIAVSGKVNWISPVSAVGYPPGVGVHFNSDKTGQEARSRIEILLGGLLQNNNFDSATF